MRLVKTFLPSRGLILGTGMAAKARPIAAPGSTKNAGDEGDPEMPEVRTAHRWYLGMETHMAWTPYQAWCTRRQLAAHIELAGFLRNFR